MSTPALVRDVASTLKDAPDAELQVYLDIASNWLSESAWGAKYPTGLALMAAHLKTLESRGGKGQVTSMSAGGVSRSYASLGTDELAQTSYGALFLSLRRTLPLTPVVLGASFE